MPEGAAWRPDPLFAALGPEFQDVVVPAEFPKAILRFRNERAAATIGLDTLTDDEWLAAFARFEPLPGQPAPLAMRYHGHQFRSYNAELGDGRGFLFAQMREAGTNRLLDLGTKGSGRTPWSRSGDGRLTLKGGVREVLAATMLEALGVPTSRAFSLVETGEALTRGDEPSPTRSSVLVRLQHSHVRFGTFQRLAFYNRPDLVQALTDHVIAAYHPLAQGAAALLEIVVAATARMTARWMSAGFVHGVLNTDNMNVTGESFDYGPWRFLPQNDPNLVAAYFDHSGLYSFGRQPEAAFWNLQQLAGALSLIEQEEALVAALNTFSPTYARELAAAMIARLGVESGGEDADIALVNAGFKALAAGGEALRWEPFFFDWFCGPASEARAMNGPRADLYASEAFAEFRRLLTAARPDRPDRLASPVFGQAEPEEMLIDEVEAIWAGIDQNDDWSMFDAKLSRIEAAGDAYALGGAGGGSFNDSPHRS